MVDESGFLQALDEAKLAGAVALIGGKDSVTYLRAFGQRDVSSGVEMTPDTIMQIASMTKAITSVAALQQVEQGKLTLDGPIGEILPELDQFQVLEGFDDAGKPKLRPAHAPITLRQLLTHTSGIGYPFVSMDLLRTIDPQDPPAPNSMASISVPLLFDPGEQWEYGMGTDWVGLAVERVSGQRLDAYVADHITGPLRMLDTVFFLSSEQEERAARIHARLPDGGLKPINVRISGDPKAEIIAGGGGLWSTAADYYIFLRALLNGGAPVLSTSSVAMLGINQIGRLKAGRMESAMADFAAPFEPFPDQHCGWSLAFLLNPEPGPNGRAGGSMSWAGIANTHFWVDPADDVIGIFMAQLLPFGDPGALNAFGAFERMAYGL